MLRNVSIVFLILILTAAGCTTRQDEADTGRLMLLDSLLGIQPGAVADSLLTLQDRRLSNYNRAYAQLLEVIARDKTYYDFTSDSLIYRSVRTLTRYKKAHRHTYARSLMYLGVVRFRMGITDSTAYLPLKEAVKLFEKESPPDNRNGYLAYYYLGNIHTYNQNIQIAEKYYLHSLALAKHLNNSLYLLANYQSLFWNRMQLPDYKQAKNYLDTVSTLTSEHLQIRIEYRNMQSVYYQKTANYLNALQAEQDVIRLKKENKQDVTLSNLYNMSVIYNNLEQRDSAYYYGKLAVQAIKDTTYRLNYLYYKNLAEYAAQLHKWQESAQTYQQMYERMSQSMEKKHGYPYLGVREEIR